MTAPAAALWDLPPLRGGHPAGEVLAARRQEAATRPLLDGPPAGIVVRLGEVGGVGCVVCEPAEPIRTVIYLHGGGYGMGAPRNWTPFAGRLASRCDARVLIVDYGLAPEDPFPAALHDCARVYDALGYDALGDPVSHEVFVMGDSAGGGLAAAFAAATLRAGRPSLAGAVLISPWADLTVTAESYVGQAGTDILFSSASAKAAADEYLQGYDSRDPLASPVFAELSGFPRCLVFAGGDEVLIDDSLVLAAGLARAGTSVDLVVEAGMQHVFVTREPDLEQSRRAFERIVGFVNG